MMSDCLSCDVKPCTCPKPGDEDYNPWTDFRHVPPGQTPSLAAHENLPLL